ncbi:hypothetical protein BE17_52355 [Sorangium cellulosum]|uniref:Uncharacterized protein n=1 Tax=Sorangium cellulosum TaxID=56 RepID=A0A150RBS8_SORCE|nr:hypothetical protein BE17_52355 [Sorangium cellulosum]
MPEALPLLLLVDELLLLLVEELLLLVDELLLPFPPLPPEPSAASLSDPQAAIESATRSEILHVIERFMDPPGIGLRRHPRAARRARAGARHDARYRRVRHGRRAEALVRT